MINKASILLLGMLAELGHSSVVQITPNNAVASSALVGDWAAGMNAAAAINGNTQDFFSSNYQSSAGPTQYIDLNFQNIISNIQMIRLYPRVGGYCFPGTITLQYDEFGNGVWKDILPWSFSYPIIPTGQYIDLGFVATPVNAKSIRIKASNLRADAYGNYYFQMAEIQVFRQDQLNSIGETRKAAPTSSFDDGAIWPSSRLIDNNTTSAYSSTPTQINQSRSCGISFPGKMYGISRVELYPVSGGWCFPKSFKLRYREGQSDPWKDIPGQKYANIAVPAAGTAFIAEFHRYPINAQAIQLVSLENRPDAYGNYYLQLGEISAFIEAGMQFRNSGTVTISATSPEQNYTVPVTTYVYAQAEKSIPWTWFNAAINKNLWDSKNVDPFDNGAVYSSPVLQASIGGPYSSAATSPAAVIIHYPEPVWTDGVMITPNADGIGFPPAFTIQTSTRTDLSNGDGTTPGWTTEATYTNFTPPSGTFKVPFAVGTEGGKFVKHIKIETQQNWFDGSQYYFLQLKGFSAALPLQTATLKPANPTAQDFSLVDNRDGDGPYGTLTQAIYTLNSETYVKRLRIALKGGNKPTTTYPTTVEYKSENGSWSSVPWSYFDRTDKTVISISVNQNIKSIRVTTAGACLTGGSCTTLNGISEITPLY